MVIIEILPDCLGDPIRLACFFGSSFSDTVGIIVSNDDPLPDVPRYELHVACGEANINTIRNIHLFHNVSDGDPCGIPLAKYRSPLCINRESCSFACLSMQELLVPLVINELATYQGFATSHRND